MRQVDERIAGVRLERDRRVREAVAGGASYREVAKAIGLAQPDPADRQRDALAATGG
jgi:hypothetical protein